MPYGRRAADRRPAAGTSGATDAWSAAPTVTGGDRGRQDGTVTSTARTTAIQPTGPLHRPRFHGPGVTPAPACGRSGSGAAYAGVPPVTPPPVTAPRAVAGPVRAAGPSGAGGPGRVQITFSRTSAPSVSAPGSRGSQTVMMR
ncbi:hypothetical protein GCM10010421_48230 [Streptomyces glaucus]|uniref:Secreted protein n=1 Tax=Streptomyces glaucus TaxID=284029 RepID=A0ABP5XDX0_9ACTN